MKYYHIPKDKTNLIIWLILSILLTLLTAFTCFFLLLIPLFVFLGLKNRDYYYNDEKIIIESGIFIKKQYIIPLYRVVNINAISTLCIGSITIQDKGQTHTLMYVKKPRKELIPLVEKWEKAKEKNIRNEVI